MSETILEHGYIPEEHAPDPVISHGDPTAPGKIGIWLFLASEVMFFVAILGTYVILRAGSPGLFEKHSAVLSKAWAGTNTLVLIFSSLTMALAVDASQKGDSRRVAKCLGITLLWRWRFWVSRRSSTRTKPIIRRLSPTRMNPSPWSFIQRLPDRFI